MFNLSLDPWPFVEFDLADDRAIDRLERLSVAGTWEPDRRLAAARSGDRVVVRFNGAVGYDTPLFVTVHWGAGSATGK